MTSFHVSSSFVISYNLEVGSDTSIAALKGYERSTLPEGTKNLKQLNSYKDLRRSAGGLLLCKCV